MFLKTIGMRMGSAVTLCSLVSTLICPRQTCRLLTCTSIVCLDRDDVDGGCSR